MQRFFDNDDTCWTLRSRDVNPRFVSLLVTVLLDVRLGTLKMHDLKMQHLKVTDQLVRRENARHENARPEIVGPENIANQIAFGTYMTTFLIQCLRNLVCNIL